MSYRFDKTEVPQFHKDFDAELMVNGCVACGEHHERHEQQQWNTRPSI